MRNKYPGTCYRCGGHVAAGEGHFERHDNRWLVQHASCAIKYRGTDIGKEADAALHLDNQRRLAKGTGKIAQRARKYLREMGQ